MKIQRIAAVLGTMDNAMTRYQKRLEPMVGSFDVRVLVWVDPAKPPIETTASAASTWVLGNRFEGQMPTTGGAASLFIDTPKHAMPFRSSARAAPSGAAITAIGPTPAAGRRHPVAVENRP